MQLKQQTPKACEASSARLTGLPIRSSLRSHRAQRSDDILCGLEIAVRSWSSNTASEARPLHLFFMPQQIKQVVFDWIATTEPSIY
jgi:hypothetical protein